MSTASPEYFTIWGCINDDASDAQIVWEQWASPAAANAKLDELNDDPKNHPDLAFWLETGEHDPGYPDNPDS